MLQILTKSVVSLLLITNIHSGSMIKQTHYTIINNQIPKITQITYLKERKKKEAKKQNSQQNKIIYSKPNSHQENNQTKPSTPAKTIAPIKFSQTSQNAHTVTMNVSAYTYSGGVGNGHTCADGTVPEQGVTIAAGSAYPFGTQMIINGHTYTVHDRGSAIGPNDIDLFLSSEQACIQFGRQNLQVTVLN